MCYVGIVGGIFDIRDVSGVGRLLYSSDCPCTDRSFINFCFNVSGDSHSLAAFMVQLLVYQPSVQPVPCSISTVENYRSALRIKRIYQTVNSTEYNRGLIIYYVKEFLLDEALL
jgi:hypothetical protein